MSPSFPTWKSLPFRRVLALDPGSQRIKLLLVQNHLGRIRILKQELLDLQAEGLLSAEEIQAHIQGVLDAAGHPAIALTVPQHVTISQTVDLALAADQDPARAIADETIKLSGVSDSRIVYDFVPVEHAPKGRHRFWVTLCQEGEIRERILQLGIQHEDICEVTSTANALLGAYRAAAPNAENALLIHVGAQTTVLVALLAGQGAYATSFQMGGEFFTRSLLRSQQGSHSAAESLKRSTDLLAGPSASADLITAVDGWAAEVKRQFQEWLAEHGLRTTPAAPFAGLPLIASGASFEQPGFLAYLKQRHGLELQPWPPIVSPKLPAIEKDFEIAFGTALQALGLSPQPVSLLPSSYRAGWNRRLMRQRIETGSLVLAVIVLVFLGFGIWQKASLLRSKTAFLAKIEDGQRAFEANQSLTADLTTDYETLRPILARQQNSIDILRTLTLLEHSRSNRNLWYVLLADQQSYFSHPPAMLATNRPARTNVLGPALAPPEVFIEDPRALAASTLTNVSPAKPGLIAELCVPGDPDSSRQVLAELVNDLRQQALFAKADLLSEDLRRSLADPKVIVPDRHYALALDFAETEFYQTAARRPMSGGRDPSRRTAGPRLPLWQGPEPDSGKASRGTP
jgi:Tfp pilus assembly PilM family ATPase